MAIAKHWFCFHRIISVLIFKYVWGYCLVGRPAYGQASWQRQTGFWLKCPGTWCRRAPGPLAAIQPQSMNDLPPYLMVGMRCFSLYASLFWRQTCWCCTWPKSSILVSSDQWRLANSRCLNLLVAVSKGFLLLSFQRACLYGVLWLIFRLCDTATQLKSTVLTVHPLPGNFETFPDVWNF